MPKYFLIFTLYYSNLNLVTAKIYQVNALPTFVLIHNHEELGRVTGVNINSIQRLITSNLSLSNKKQFKLNENSATPIEKQWLEKFLVYYEQVFLNNKTY